MCKKIALVFMVIGVMTLANVTTIPFTSTMSLMDDSEPVCC
jgi:Tfp pilus assembly protein PilV